MTNQEACFANYRLWESLGFVIAFAYQNFICVRVKLIILLCVLVVGISLYYFVEVNTTVFVTRVRASASGAVDSGFDSDSGQTNDFLIGVYNFPA